MRRHGFFLQQETTARKDSSYIIYRLVPFIKHEPRLQYRHSFTPHNSIAMEKNAVRNDMTSETTDKFTGA